MGGSKSLLNLALSNLSGEAEKKSSLSRHEVVGSDSRECVYEGRKRKRIFKRGKEAGL